MQALKQSKPSACYASALAFLTIIPLKQPCEWDDRGKLAFFPIAGLTIGAMLICTDWIAGFFFSSIAARAIVDILFLSIITGGLHLDGLADSADGLLSHGDRKTALDIMKDPHIGVFGTVALILVLQAKWCGIAFFLPSTRWMALLFVPVYSRSAMLVCFHLLPYARKQGIASGFASQKGGWKELYFLLVPLILPFFFSWKCALAFILLSTVLTLAWCIICRRKIEGITGDTAGALGEIVEAALFITGCAI